MTPLRLGVAGLGFGGAVHLPALRALPGVEIVVIASRSPHVRSLAERFGIPTVVEGWEALLMRDLDAVSLALPPAVNELACAAALARNLPVLSEKPLAVTADAARRLATASAGITTAVDFQFAELPAFRQLEVVLRRGQLGAVRHVQVTWLVESYAQEHRKWSWKTDQRAGGGVGALLASHIFYLLEHFFGRMNSLNVEASNGATRRFAPSGEIAAEDTVALTAVHESGMSSGALISNASPGGIGHRWECICDEGTIVLHNPTRDYMSGFQLCFYHRDRVDVVYQETHSRGVDGRIEPFRSLAARFAEAVRKGGRMEPDFTAGARVQELLSGIRVRTN